MSKITPDILAKLAPATAKDKRDRFLPFLNEACLRYGITTELRVAAFLATICFESNYFRATKEGRATKPGAAKTAQDRYWPTGFYGRGLIQTTHEAGYKAFSKAMFKAGVVDDPSFFVKNPEVLEQPKWAVESACSYWKENGLNELADKGKFFAIQGLVNRGNAKKEAWGYDDRAAIYEKCLRFMPDDFNLSAPAPLEAPTPPTDNGEPAGIPTDVPLDQPAPIKPQPALAPIEVPQISAAVDEPKPKDDEPSKLVSIGNKATALWGSIGATVLAIGAFLTSTPLGIAISIIGSIGLIVAIYMIVNALRQGGKEKREAAAKLEIAKAELELKKQREAQAFQLQIETIRAAADPNKHTVTITPPTVEMPNSDAPVEEPATV